MSSVELINLLEQAKESGIIIESVLENLDEIEYIKAGVDYYCTHSWEWNSCYEVIIRGRSIVNRTSFSHEKNEFDIDRIVERCCKDCVFYTGTPNLEGSSFCTHRNKQASDSSILTDIINAIPIVERIAKIIEEKRDENILHR